jgi:hypothetical protein
MTLEAFVDDESAECRRKAHQTAYTASSNAGAFIANGSNVAITALGPDMGSTAFHEHYVVCYGASAQVATTERYEPAMVAQLLKLDAQAPEAKFNNVVDMMEWLDSD